jgi:hypothetical protein
MSILAEQLDATLQKLTPSVASRLERLVRDAMAMACPDGEKSDVSSSQQQPMEHRVAAVAALQRIADRGDLDSLDPLEWQREQREDRVLGVRE